MASPPPPGRCCPAARVPPALRCGTGGPGPLRPRAPSPSRRATGCGSGPGLRERARATVRGRAGQSGPGWSHVRAGLTMAAAPGAVPERRLPMGTAGPRRGLAEIAAAGVGAAPGRSGRGGGRGGRSASPTAAPGTGTGNSAQHRALHTGTDGGTSTRSRHWGRAMYTGHRHQHRAPGIRRQD